MSTSKAETGHAVNISNYKVLIDTCTGFGGNYQPSNEDVTVPNMTVQWTAASNVNLTLSKAMADIKEPINAREIIYSSLNKLMTKVMGAVNSSKANDLVKKDVKTIADKIRGMNRSKKPKETSTDGDATLASISTSHQGFVQRAAALLDLVNLLATVKEYKPNETELKTASLADLQAQMQTANDGIGAILDTASVALLARNRVLYKPVSGIVDVAQACRDYVKSVFGSQAAEYKKVTAIKFRDLSKKEKEKL